MVSKTPRNINCRSSHFGLLGRRRSYQRDARHQRLILWIALSAALARSVERDLHPLAGGGVFGGRMHQPFAVVLKGDVDRITGPRRADRAEGETANRGDLFPL